jgi:hypothetical protein
MPITHWESLPETVMWKKWIGIAVVVLLSLSLITSAHADENDDGVIAAATRIGTALNTVFFGSPSDGVPEIAGVILGEEISAREVEIRAAMYELAGSENPLEEAWNSLRVTIYEKQFAAEHQITPTADEIAGFTSEMKETVYSQPGGQEYALALLEAIGMGEDEYWNEYKPQYESPAHLTSIKVAEYLNANGLPDLSYDEVLALAPGEITNEALIEKWSHVKN